MNNYIAVDVSKQTLNVFDGKKEFEIKNKRGLKELKSYIRNNYKGRKKRNLVIIFESTGSYSDYLKEFCISSRIKAYIMNPKKSANFSKAVGNRSKTDRVDARMIYAFRVLIDDKDLKIPRENETSKEFSYYLSTYELILKTRVSFSNHIKSTEYQDHVPGVLTETLKKEVERCKFLEEYMIEKMEEAAQSDKKLKEDYHNLRTIPGIGRVSAVALLSLFTKYRGTNRSEITALVGLDPVKRESGSSLREKSKISKSGDKTLRKILYFPTMNAIQHNETIKVFYERLVKEKRKPKKVALIASMKKLLLIAHAVYKNKTEYRDYSSNTDKKGKKEKIIKREKQTRSTDYCRRIK